MLTVDIIYDPILNISKEELIAILEQNDITIQKISAGNPLEIIPSHTTCIHIVASSMGVSNTEKQSLEAVLSHRFVGAETALTAQSLFVQVVIGMHQTTLHIFIPYDKSILGNLSFLTSQLSIIQETEAQLQAPQSTPSSPSTEPSRVQLTQITEENTPSPDMKSWESILASLGGSIDYDTWADLTPELQKPAPVRNILEQAGTRKYVRFENGNTYTIYGYPNLTQNNAKILLIGAKNRHLEIIALHRAPQKIGVVSPHGCGWLPQQDIVSLAKEKTGRVPPKTDVTIFALDSSSMYYESAGNVYHWDGKREELFGTPNQALASLLLQWSQR